MAAPNKKFAAFQGFLSKQHVMIVDANASSRAGIAKAMNDMGAKSTQMALCSSLEEAEEAIKKQKPKILITDFTVGTRSGLELLQRQRQADPTSKDSIFVLVTGNTSQSAVAQAAEEDVDAFILKPYTLDVFRQSLMQAVLNKIQPDQYTLTIDEGKKKLFAGDPDGAIPIFESALTQNPKPALAHFYLGQARELKKTLQEAEGSYHKGLETNKIHYKCMVGLYELHLKNNRTADAYEIVKRLSRYFPANPERLSGVLRLAIATQSYDDIERYYQMFTTIDQRNDSLIRYVCAALVVCGKYYLMKKFPSRATDLFQKAAVTAGGRTSILKEIVSALTEYDMSKEAEAYLKRFPADTLSKPDFLVSELIVHSKLLAPTMVADRARKLVDQGIEDPTVYRIWIGKLAELGSKNALEEARAKAIAKFPKLKAEFEAPQTKGSGGK